MYMKANLKQRDIKKTGGCITHINNFNKKHFQFGWYSIQFDIVYKKQGCVGGFLLIGQNPLSMTKAFAFTFSFNSVLNFILGFELF